MEWAVISFPLDGRTRVDDARGYLLLRRGSPEGVYSFLLVVHDDADLELGRLRVRPGGRAGGHNGMLSLIEALRTDRIPRVKLGVRGAGRDEVELAEYVLEDFASDEGPIAEKLADLAVEAVGSVLDHGLETTMNRYNACLLTPTDRPDRSEED